MGHSTDHKMASGTCQSSKCHNKDTCSNSCFQFVSENTCEQQKHHHSAACTDKSAYKTNDSAAENGLNQPLFRADQSHSFFSSHNRTNNKLDTEQQGHDGRKTAHCGIRNFTCNKTSDKCKYQNGNHHDKTVFDIQIFIFSISISTDSTGKNIAGKGNADSFISRYPQKCNEHRTYYGGSTHSGKSGSKTCSHTGKKTNNDFN